MAGIIRGLVLTPRLGPMSAGRFALTYLLPVAPAVVAWDGIVSSLRSDSVRELLDLAASATGESFAWSVTCLVGLPAETD